MPQNENEILRNRLKVQLWKKLHNFHENKLNNGKNKSWCPENSLHFLNNFFLLILKNEYNPSPDEELIGMCPVHIDKPIADINTLKGGGTPADWPDHKGLILMKMSEGPSAQSVGFWEVVDKEILPFPSPF